jgi:tetratricopeptide (TPR) repeat protein
MIVSISGVNHQRNRSMEEVQKLWAVSDRLLVDPSETRETTLSFRMNQARKILDDETARHGWMTRDSMWRSLFVRSGDAMAAKLWFCGRIERLTNELQQRSRGSKSSEDQKAILLYLKQGLAIQNQQQWYNEAVAINQRLGNSDQIKRLQEPEEINAEIANYLTAIDQEKDDSKTTVEMLEKLSRQNPSQFVFHFELGRNLAIREEHAAAITNLEKAVELNLQSFEAKRLLAAEYFRNQQYQLADELTKMALRMRPDDISTLRLSVMIKFYFGQKNQLQDEIRRLEEIVLYDRGMKQVDQLPEKLDDAFDNEPANQVVFNLDTIDNLLKMIPEDPDLLKLKAKRLYLDNRHLESRIILEKLQQKSELSTFDLINLATLYHRENASRKSAELIRNAIERPDFERWFARNPNVRFLAHTAGESFEMHDLRVAREYYEKIIKINEMNKAHLGRFYFYLARCLIREDAQKNLESATNLLLKAGFQQSKYLYRWYQDEPVFDSVRSQIDPVLQASFAELSSDSQRDIELKSEKK